METVVSAKKERKKEVIVSRVCHTVVNIFFASTEEKSTPTYYGSCCIADERSQS